MPKINTIVLRTDLSAEECLRRLGEATDQGKRTIFSLSGYKGSKPVLATFDGNRFKLWKRIYYRNDFRPYFYGTLVPQDRGCRIEGYFDVDRWMKFFVWFWLAFVVLAGVLPTIIATASQPIRGDAWIGVIVPLGLILFGIFLPKFGRWLARDQETFLKEFVETTLAATPEAGGVVVSQRFVDNTPL
jgi:hypothetical protein